MRRQPSATTTPAAMAVTTRSWCSSRAISVVVPGEGDEAVNEAEDEAEDEQRRHAEDGQHADHSSFSTYRRMARIWWALRSSARRFFATVITSCGGTP